LEMKRKTSSKKIQLKSTPVSLEPQNECFANADLVLTIFYLLHPLELGNALVVNTYWKNISSSIELWKFMGNTYLNAFYPKDFTSVEFGLEYQKQNAIIQSSCQEICADPKRGWLRPIFHVAKSSQGKCYSCKQSILKNSLVRCIRYRVSGNIKQAPTNVHAACDLLLFGRDKRLFKVYEKNVEPQKRDFGEWISLGMPRDNIPASIGALLPAKVKLLNYQKIYVSDFLQDAVCDNHTTTTRKSLLNEINEKLTKVTENYYVLNVDKNQYINDFIVKSGHRYKNGNAFYEFTKEEIILKHKQIIVMDLKDNQIYGDQEGDEIKMIFGIADEGSIKPFVNPEYKIFVQSISSQRVVQSGTLVLLKK